jgi:hypothetical protein
MCGEQRPHVRRVKSRDLLATLARTLESSLEGVDWLLNRWSILITILETEGYCHYPEKFDAIRLLGRRPDDVLHDPVVDRIMVACNVLHLKRWELNDDCIQATLNLKGHPIYLPRVQHLESRGPATPELACEELRAIAEAEVARLEHLKATVVGPLAAIDRAEAPARAAFIAGPEGASRLRYEGANDRGLHRALTEFMKLRKARLAEAAEQPQAAAPARCEACRCAPRPSDPMPTSKPAAAESAGAQKSAGSGRL